VELSAQTTRNVFKEKFDPLRRVLVAAVAALSPFPNAAVAAPHQHHDQVPGFYRLTVGDLEVTALYDGTGVFRSAVAERNKATMDGVVKALQEDPHTLDVVDMGFLVNTGKQLILVDAGAGTWWVAGLSGAWRAASAAQATHRKKSTSFWSRTSIPITSAPHNSDGNRVFPNADVYVAKAESDFWLSPGNRC